MATKSTKKVSQDEANAKIETTNSVSEKTEATNKSTSRVKSVKKRKEKLPGDMIVECQNMTMGKLIYISSRQNGYKIVWSNPGDIEEIELSELMTMRNSQPRFFTDNWIGMDEEILRYLGVDKYYKGVPDFEDYEGIFELPFEEMQVAISNLPKGMKDTFSYKAEEMINNGEIDSVKVIKYLCEVFNLILDD